MDNNKLVVKNEEDSQKAFENAKSKGLNKPEEYMYMYSKDNKDYFKNINFRNYISFEEEKKEFNGYGGYIYSNINK
jgi:hypothetical protein